MTVISFRVFVYSDTPYKLISYFVQFVAKISNFAGKLVALLQCRCSKLLRQPYIQSVECVPEDLKELFRRVWLQVPITMSATVASSKHIDCQTGQHVLPTTQVLVTARLLAAQSADVLFWLALGQRPNLLAHVSCEM